MDGCPYFLIICICIYLDMLFPLKLLSEKMEQSTEVGFFTSLYCPPSKIKDKKKATVRYSIKSRFNTSTHALNAYSEVSSLGVTLGYFTKMSALEFWEMLILLSHWLSLLCIYKTVCNMNSKCARALHNSSHTFQSHCLTCTVLASFCFIPFPFGCSLCSSF